MKMTTLLAAAALALTSAVPAFAHGMSKKDVKIINDSAAALQSMDADLSSRLSALASREQSVSSKETAAVDSQDAQTLRDGAAKLRDSRPDLSKGLDRIAKKESREHKRGVKSRNDMPAGSNPAQRNPSGTQTPPAQPQQTPNGY